MKFQLVIIIGLDYYPSVVLIILMHFQFFMNDQEHWLFKYNSRNKIQPTTWFKIDFGVFSIEWKWNSVQFKNM